MALHTRRDFYGLTTGINTRHLYPTSRKLAHITGMQVQRNKAIVGQNAFAHEAGIHQDGMLKERSTYEIMKPEDVGIPRTELVLGKHSGRHALKQRVADLGYHLDRRTTATACSRSSSDWPTGRRRFTTPTSKHWPRTSPSGRHRATCGRSSASPARPAPDRRPPPRSR